MVNYAKNRIKVGLYVFGAFILLVIVIIKISDFHYLFFKTKQLSIIFKNVQGLKINDPVYYSGVLCGKVVDIKIKQKNKIIVTIEIPSHISVYENSVVYVSRTFMGETSINIIPSSTGKEAKVIYGQENSMETSINNILHEVNTIIKENRLYIRKITTEMSRNLSELHKILKSVNTILDIKTQRYLKTSLKDISFLINNTNSTIKNINFLIEKNSNKISNILTNLELASSNIELMTHELKRHPWKLIRKGGVDNSYKYALKDLADALNNLLEVIKKDNSTLKERQKVEKLLKRVEYLLSKEHYNYYNITYPIEKQKTFDKRKRRRR